MGLACRNLRLCTAMSLATLLVGGCDKVPTWGELTGKSGSAKTESSKTVAAPKSSTGSGDQVADTNPNSPQNPASPNGTPNVTPGATTGQSSPVLTAITKQYGSLDKCQSLTLIGGQQPAATFIALKELPSLQTLNASGCVLDSHAMKGLGQLTSLVHLNLDGAQFNPLDLEFLKGLTGLRMLDLSNTNIEDQHLGLIRNIPLDSLRVTKTQIMGFWFANQSGADKWFGGGLKMIDANLTQFATAGFVYIKGSTELEVLCAVESGAADNQMTGLVGCTNLRVLTLRGCNISDQGTVHFKKLVNLEVIDLSGNRLMTEKTLNSLVRQKKQTKLVEMVPADSFADQTLQVFKAKYHPDIVYSESLREMEYYSQWRGIWDQPAINW